MMYRGKLNNKCSKDRGKGQRAPGFASVRGMHPMLNTDLFFFFLYLFRALIRLSLDDRHRLSAMTGRGRRTKMA